MTRPVPRPPSASISYARISPPVYNRPVICEECEIPQGGGHRRTCPSYSGKSPVCALCLRKLKARNAKDHRRWCALYGSKRPKVSSTPKKTKVVQTSAPLTCGCKNHNGQSKRPFKTKKSAMYISRRRWAGRAQAYKCPKNPKIWHLTTSGRIRGKKRGTLQTL